MTLLEFLKLLKAHLKTIVIVTVVCGVVGFGGTAAIAKLNPSYSATASVVVSSGSINAVGGIANSVAQDYSKNGVTVKATTTSSSTTVTVEAKGKVASSCINAANGAANEISNSAIDKEAAKTTTVSLAKTVKNESPSAKKYGALGALGGLFVIMCLIALRDSIKPRVRDWHVVEKDDGLRFLGKLGDETNALNLIETNLLLSRKSATGNEDVEGKHAGAGSANAHANAVVCLVPAGATDKAPLAAEAIEAASTSGKLASITALASIDDEPYALLGHPETDIFAVVVEEEITTYADIDQVVREFKIAGIKPAGFIYCEG